MEALGVVLTRSSPYNSRANSAVERSIRTIQDQCRIARPAIETLGLFLQLACYKHNFGVPSKGNLNPAQKFFLRSHPIRSALPDLSINRKAALDENTKNLYEAAIQIRQSCIEGNRKAREAMLRKIQSSNFHRGDTVRVKNFTQVKSKKLWHPYSSTHFKSCRNTISTALIDREIAFSTVQFELTGCFECFGLSRLQCHQARLIW